MLLETEPFHSLLSLPETSFYSKRSSRILQIHSFYKGSQPIINFTTRINSTFKTFQRHPGHSRHSSHSRASTSRHPKGSTLSLHSPNRMPILQFYKNPGFQPYQLVSTENSTEYQLKLSTRPSTSKKGRCCDISYFQ